METVISAPIVYVNLTLQCKKEDMNVTVNLEFFIYLLYLVIRSCVEGIVFDSFPFLSLLLTEIPTSYFGCVSFMVWYLPDFLCDCCGLMASGVWLGVF